MDAIIKMYELSPYDKTIKLDVDMIWIEGRNPNKLFIELENIDFTISNKGRTQISDSNGLMIWANEQDVIAAYKLTGKEYLYHISAEFVYFKKSKTSKSFFSKAMKVYQQKKIVGKEFSNANFTEELAFQVTFMLTGNYPHKERFKPIYNSYLEDNNYSDRRYPYELTAYYGYSIVGNNIGSHFIKNNYNILAKHYFAKLGLSNPYQVVDKRTFLPERKSL
jgi:hypothetical protein